jgi:hypothetical protein
METQIVASMEETQIMSEKVNENELEVEKIIKSS